MFDFEIHSPWRAISFPQPKSILNTLTISKARVQIPLMLSQ
jgi:hypothetical protein